MQIVILDGNAVPQTVAWQAPTTPSVVKPANGNPPAGSLPTMVDQSGAIAQTSKTQTLMPANPNRSGWMVQNLSDTGNWMFVNDLGTDATQPGAFRVLPGAFFPPPGYVISTGDIEIAGTAGDAFTAREW